MRAKRQQRRAAQRLVTKLTKATEQSHVDDHLQVPLRMQVAGGSADSRPGTLLGVLPHGEAEEDSALPAEPAGFLNSYRCDRCDTEWQDVWSCACNDQCPSCGTKDIEPFESEEINDHT